MPYHFVSGYLCFILLGSDIINDGLAIGIKKFTSFLYAFVKSFKFALPQIAKIP